MATHNVSFDRVIRICRPETRNEKKKTQDQQAIIHSFNLGNRGFLPD